MKTAVYPALGSLVPVKLVQELKQGESESATAFAERKKFCEPLMDAEIDVEMLDRDKPLEWSYEMDLILTAEEKRKRDLEQQGQPVPRGFTLEGSRALRAQHKKVVQACVRGARGLQVGDRSLADVKDGEELVKLFDAMNLLADVARLARDTQQPTPTQLES